VGLDAGFYSVGFFGRRWRGWVGIGDWGLGMEGWGMGDRNVWRGVGGRGGRSGLVLEEGSVLMVIIMIIRGYCGIWVD